MAKVVMEKRVARWYYAEVAREHCANDNMGVAEWCAMWSKSADMMKAKGWRAQEMAMREMVAEARAANRPCSV